MARLQRISMNQKGRDTAVKVIEQTAVFGSKHLVDESLHAKNLEHYFFSFYFFFIFLMALVYGNYHYYSQVNQNKQLSEIYVQWIFLRTMPAKLALNYWLVHRVKSIAFPLNLNFKNINYYYEH